MQGLHLMSDMLDREWSGLARQGSPVKPYMCRSDWTGTRHSVLGQDLGRCFALPFRPIRRSRLCAEAEPTAGQKKGRPDLEKLPPCEVCSLLRLVRLMSTATTTDTYGPVRPT